MVLSEVDLLGFTYRTGALVATHRECVPMQWLSIYFSDPLDCVPWVRRFTNCVGSYFVHSTNDDNGCGHACERWAHAHLAPHDRSG